MIPVGWFTTAPNINQSPLYVVHIDIFGHGEHSIDTIKWGICCHS